MTNVALMVIAVAAKFAQEAPVRRSRVKPQPIVLRAIAPVCWVHTCGPKECNDGVPGKLMHMR